MSGAELEVRRAGPRSWPWVLLLFLATSWPWYSNLTRWPMSADAPIWYERGDPARDTWRQWVFDSNHFGVGYRPVAALTVTAEQWIGPPNALLLRGIDLGLHLGVVLVLVALARRLVPGLGRSAGLLAAGALLVHPLLEEVVPFTSRRSYLLANFLALAGLWIACRAARGESAAMRRIGPSFATGACLALAVLSNEVAVVMVAVLPVLVWSCERPGAGRLARCGAALVGPAILLALTVLARQSVVGGVGGYTEQEREPFSQVFAHAWGWLLSVGLGKRTLLGGGQAAIWSALVAVLLVHGWLGRRLAREQGGSYGALVACLLVWTALPALLFGTLGVLYPRQVYACLVPWALLTGVQLAGSLRHLTGATRGAALAAQGLLLVGVLGSSPVLRGPDPEREAVWSARDAILDELARGLEGVTEPANVHLVLPVKARRERRRADSAAAGRRRVPSRDDQALIRWARLLVGARDIDLMEWAYVEEDPWTFEDPPRLALEEGRWVLDVPADRPLHAGKARQVHASEERPNTLVLKRLDARNVYAFVYGPGGGELRDLN